MGPLITSTYDYLHFLGRYTWLQGYALLNRSKANAIGSLWEEWPDALQNPQSPELLQQYRQEMTDHCLIEYLCFKQLQEVKTKAAEAGVFIKGDIPILINRGESADVWQWRHLFHLDYEQEAPPDMYAKEGQKWGFPLYNWEEYATLSLQLVDHAPGSSQQPLPPLSS